VRRIIVGCVVLVFVGMSVGAAAAVSPTVSDPPTNVTLVHQHPHKDCDGDHDTLTWMPPANTGGEPLTGYFIEEFNEGTNPPSVLNVDVGPDVTSLDVRPLVGFTSFSVFAKTASGMSERTSVGLFADGVPSPQQFYFTYDLDSVQQHAITTSASWFVETKISGVGGIASHSTVTITIAPGGQSVSYQAQDPGVGVPVTFRHLASGVEYHFTAVTANECGSTASADSGAFTTGAAPRWGSAKAPLDVAYGDHYRFRFIARGVPKAKYTLNFTGPEWLSIDPVTGLVSGKPPKGTNSFSYSVVAFSSFGIEAWGGLAYVMAGPFFVTVGLPPPGTSSRAA
jgi:hypothetical protein